MEEQKLRLRMEARSKNIMKTFIITYVLESGARVKQRIDATSMQAAIRVFLSKKTASGLTDAITFNILKLQAN